MSDDVKVYFDKPADMAGRLLSAAREIGEDVSVVVFSPDGYFTVPSEVADAAGVDFELDQDGSEEPQGADESVSDDSGDLEDQGGGSDATDGDSDEDDDAPEGEPKSFTVPQKGEEGYLAGKGLAQALKDRDLPDEGTADEKRARVAEYDANKE